VSLMTETRTVRGVVDQRLTSFDAEVRSGDTRVLSVDCFDTLLWRQVPKPTDLHLLVGRRLKQLNVLMSHITPRGFARLRVLAEEEARRRKLASNSSGEVTLEEIHAILAPVVTTSESYEVLPDTELEVERDALFVDAKLAAYLRETLAVANARLIIVSDTYFSEAQLRSFLNHRDLFGVTFDRVYTSSDHRTGKGALLWETVLNDLGVSPVEIVHLGDNVEADVTCARRRGIRAVHYPMSTERFVAIDAREGISGRDEYPSPWIDERRGDGGITAIRRRATLGPVDRKLTTDDQVAWETGAAIFGPVFTGFAQWIHEKSELAGAQRLLFLMREGRFLMSLVDRTPPNDGWEPRTRTLWVSREACARASIYDGSRPELDTFLERLRPPSPYRLIDSLGLDADDIPELDRLEREFAASGERDILAGSFLDLIVERPALIAKMIERSALRRRRLIDYLRQTAGPGEGPVGLVDVGWSGSIQESLQTMFAGSEEPIDFHGLYLLAHVRSSDRVLRGVHLEGFLGTVGTDPFDVAAITGGAEIVESISTCGEGTLLEIGDGGVPILAPPPSGIREQASRELVQSGVRSYQDEWLAFREKDCTFETSPAGVAILTRILKRFVSLPSHEEALAFSWWTHEENYGSERTEQLVPARYLPTIRYRSAEDLHWAPMSDLHWTGGAAALVDNELVDAIFLMREGTVHPGRFSSPPAGTVKLRIEGGGPVDREIDPISIPVVRNRHGLSLVEWRGAVDGAERLVLSPAEELVLLRLDLLEVVDVGSEDGPETRFSWSIADGRDGLPIDGAQWVTSQVLALDRKSKLSIDFPAPLTSREIRVTLAGAFLPPPLGPRDEPLSGDVQAELAALRQEIDSLYSTKLLRSAAYPRRIYGALRRAVKGQRR
jgi:FMN phosphatase YigB (HAD superfamily)